MAYKILIIDDDAELLKMLRSYFEIKKYEVITAENGAGGLNKMKLQPDIILLDVNMPQIDGIEVCRRIRDKVACPVLFLTVRVEEQDIVKGFSAGGGDYILKPFSLKELDARITAHLKREVRCKNRTECRFQGEFLYSGNMKGLLEQAKGRVWLCKAENERFARELEKNYPVSSKQYVDNTLQIRLISEIPPEMECRSCEVTLEDAYIYIANKKF